MNTKRNYSVSAEETATLQGMGTMSARMRYLDRKGHTRYAISKILSALYPGDEGNGVRYQWVRNVLTQQVKDRS